LVKSANNYRLVIIIGKKCNVKRFAKFLRNGGGVCFKRWEKIINNRINGWRRFCDKEMGWAWQSG
jgi:hypothetical protein